MSIELMPLLDHTIQQNLEEIEECLICLNPDNKGKTKTDLVCKHIFHQECMNEWLERSSTCPMRRREVVHLNPPQAAQDELLPPENPLFSHIENGDLVRVQAWIENGPISEAERGTAVELAFENGYLDMMKMLLENGPISELGRGSTVMLAADIGHLDTVEMLLANGPISRSDRSIAIQIASMRGRLEIKQLLLREKPKYFVIAAAVTMAALASFSTLYCAQ